MQLYMVHCGFYDPEVGDGLYENHTNIFLLAEDFSAARAKVKLQKEFRAKKMHIDGLLEVQAVEGFRLDFKPDDSLAGKTRISSLKYGSRVPQTRDL